MAVSVLAVSPSHGVVGWSAVCDCGIFWSYSLTFKWLLVIENSDKHHSIPVPIVALGGEVPVIIHDFSY